MNVYKSLGALAAAAHANGDRINENVRPEDDDEGTHGLDVFHQGWYVRLRTTGDEPRWDVFCPYPFSVVLRDQYTSREIEMRRGIELDSLPENEREMHEEALLREDLVEADAHHDEFESLVKERVRPVEPDVLTLTYGEEEYWNGFAVQDHLYPSRDAFDVVEYRRVLNRVQQTTSQLATLAYEELEVLSRDPSEKSAEVERHGQQHGDGLIGFQ